MASTLTDKEGSTSAGVGSTRRQSSWESFIASFAEFSVSGRICKECVDLDHISHRCPSNSEQTLNILKNLTRLGVDVLTNHIAITV